MSETPQNQRNLERLIQLGIALSAERDHDRLLEIILEEAQRLTNADGGTIYLMSEDGDRLDFAILNNDSLGVRLGGTSEQAVDFPALPLYDGDGTALDKNVASYAAIHGQTVSVDDAYSDEDEFDFSGTQAFDSRSGYRSKSFLTIPMKERNKGEVIGVLQLINAIDAATGETVSFIEETIPHVEALASQAAVAIDNQNLLMAQRRLLEAIISLMARAIDAKSPYTGGHCTRVPDLAQRLVDAATAATEGPLADFELTEEQRYAFHIAAWLHDCGKVTTPEYVVDKATKLETIYNRIHEIRTRFEVLRRDAEIDYWKGVAEGGDEAALKHQLKERLAALDNDFTFVADCNIGGETMDPARQKRVREIAQREWTRHFDDRLGLGHEEMRHAAKSLARPLPATEKLLDDKPEHIHLRGSAQDRPFGDNPWGFKMAVPDLTNNFGEIYNLCIERGTLTEEERFSINDHIVQTIIMLESLPWPKELREVPEIAGGHHEKMDGTGYPRGLEKAEMSVPAKIMAIADIFEALTASDRPYKKAKPLSEAVRIMNFMKQDQHIDPDLFDLFLRSGVYLDYAREHLDSGQIDPVPLDEYVG